MTEKMKFKMKRKNLLIALSTIIIFVIVCMVLTNQKGSAVYNQLRKHADQIKVVDTHEHQFMLKKTEDFSADFPYIVRSSYLIADIWSAGIIYHNPDDYDVTNIDTIWDLYGKYLDYTRSTSYYGHLLRGFKKLYNLKDNSFTKENTSELSKKIAANYKNYPEWFDRAFKKAGYEVMFVHQIWDPYNVDLDERYFALVFDINGPVSLASHKPGKGEIPLFVYKEAHDAGYEINSLDDYLVFCDFLFKRNIENRAVCLKNSMAYTRTLHFEEVPYKEAAVLFEKNSSELTDSEAKKLEDFVFHWFIKKAIEYDLPIQIHTGYLAGNGNVLENGHPLKLNHLFLKYPDAKFVLFHGGFPWTTEFAALGKMFRNVYLDLVWLPQISREEAVRTLEVILDCVPYNKIFWGGDCKFIEESVGSLEYGKDIVSEVLARRVNKGLLSKDVAYEIIDRIFRENAIEVFKLDSKLIHKF